MKKFKDSYYPVVEFAEDILRMQRRIEDLEFENARLKEFEDKYNDLVMDSIKSGNIARNNMIKLLISNEVKIGSSND